MSQILLLLGECNHINTRKSKQISFIYKHFFNTQNYMILEKEIQNKLICETIKIFPVTDSKVHINTACLIIIFYKDCKQEKKNKINKEKKINIFASRSIKFYTMTF